MDFYFFLFLSVQMTILDLLNSDQKKVLINKMLEDNKDNG